MDKKILRSKSYVDFLETELQLSQNERSKVLAIDLFAGCGGLALGFEAVGFTTIGYEILEDACATYQQNLNSPCHQLNLTPSADWAANFNRRDVST